MEALFMKRRLSKVFAGLVLLFPIASPVLAAERQMLQGHVPDEVTKFNLQPVGRLDATTRLHIEFILPLRNNDALGQLHQQIYDPGSTNFHHYLTPEQFNERFGPTAQDYQAVIAFATSHNMTVTDTHPGHTLVAVDGAVPDIENALHVTLRLYQHPVEARQFFAPDAEPSLDLAVPVLAIGGLNNYVVPHPKYHFIDKGAFAEPRNGSYEPYGDDLFMGSDFRNAFAPDTTLNGSGQVVGLQEFDGYTPGDITAYEAEAGLPNVPVQEVLIGGLHNDPDNGDAEPPLDIEMAISMAPGLSKVVFYYGPNIDSILTEMADPTQGEPLPSQISSSWGYGTDSGTSNAFLRLAVQGQSYFYAMGDEGALPVDPNGPGGTYINGASPGDIEPYMTEVGGTDLSMNGVGVSWESETVWGESGPTGGPGGSSGGILTTIPIPDYQKQVSMSANGGSSTHCNVPDVAMPANYILVVVTGTDGVRNYSGVGGTSCAAPLWAGFMALVNEQAADYGVPPVGFVTPALYDIGQGPSYTSCFHDITVGNNTWSNSPTLYYAKPGYDLCTGWGSPAGASLINALVGYAGPIWVSFSAACPGTGAYYSPYCTLASGISAVATGGTISLIGPNSSSVASTITKAMTLRAFYGPVTIGN
jgi:subtilase family serine protease